MHKYKDIDLYASLGIHSSASAKDIKAAYRQLARKYHPDVNKGNKLSEKKFKEIGEAYEILSDNSKRKQYDLIRGITQDETFSKQKQTQAKTAYTKQAEPKEQEKNPEKSKTDFKNKEKSFSDVFSEFMDGVLKKPEIPFREEPKHEQPKPVDGKDITVDLSININEANIGTVRKVNVLHSQGCKTCKGRRIINGAKCKTCSGDGEVFTHNKINVKIPPNVKNGSKIKIIGEGNPGMYGGQNGDLYLKISIERTDLFEYDNLNVLSNIPISPSEAALGVSILVPTIDGAVSVKIPPETSSGQKFKLTGLGLSDKDGKTKGDHLVTVYIKMPQKLTKVEKDLYEQLSKQRTFNPREDIVYDTNQK
ncbi:MAG: DnaJ C-terminal domain-containing protein [Candidatus Gastranaerophilaceae bacterium]